LANYGHLFIAGIMFYKILEGGRNRHYVIVMLALLVEYFLHGFQVILIALYFSVFFAFVNGYLSVISIKPLVFLGSISYSLYLIHQNIGYIIINQLESKGLATSFSIIVIPLVISILIASFMQIYIERPSLIFIRKKWYESSARKYI